MAFLKPLSEPMLEYCQLDPWEQTSMKYQSKFIHFHSRKCIWNVVWKMAAILPRPQWGKWFGGMSKMDLSEHNESRRNWNHVHILWDVLDIHPTTQLLFSSRTQLPLRSILRVRYPAELIKWPGTSTESPNLPELVDWDCTGSHSIRTVIHSKPRQFFFSWRSDFSKPSPYLYQTSNGANGMDIYQFAYK